MSTDLYVVIGNPVAHSRSPWLHTRFSAITGESLRYETLLAPFDGFTATVRAFAASSGRGCNITVPFKFEAAALADTLTDRGRLARAANTLRFTPQGRIEADNTDGAGLVADIERNARVALAGRDVLLLGAGGAAAGVLGPLLAAGPARLVVVNRTHARAVELVQRHQPQALLSKTELLAQSLPALDANFDIILNATASSLAGAEVPVPPGVLRPGALALDMMYGDAARPFLEWARRHGAVPRDGLGMLVEQAAEAFHFWRGVRPPTQAVLQELRAVVAG